MAVTPKQLKDARERCGLSVLDLAAKLHIQTAQVYALESGRRGAGIETLRKYVEADVLTADEALGLGGEAA